MLRVSASICVFLFALSAGARGPVKVTYKTPTNRVLGLYDSSDAGKAHGKRVVLSQRVKAALSRLGLKLTLHDIEKGLPSSEEMKQYRAVVTAFDDPMMVRPVAYLRWLADQITEGREVVILNNLGAYQDKELAQTNPDKSWVGWPDINRPLKQLGVTYDAQWTDKPDVLKVVNGNVDMFVKGALPDPAQSAHYYRFKPVALDLVAHVLADRTDIEDGQSAVVFTSSTGGMALTRWFEGPTGSPLVDVNKFVESALFPPRQQSSRVLMVVDPESSSGHQLEQNLHWIQKYARLQADYMRFHDFKELRRRDLREYGSLVLASYGGPHLAESGQALTEIERWVREDGGGFVALFPVRRPAWDKMLGIKKWNGEAVKTEAMVWGDKFFPGLKGLHVRGDSYEADVHPVTLASDVEVLAWATDKDNKAKIGPPVMWKRTHGKGRVLFRNDAALTQKPWRGAILQTILQSMPVSAAPIINSLVYYVDDCPQPMWDVAKDPIKTEYGLTDTDFYKRVWWPDMMAMVRDFHLKLTFVLIFSYDDAVGKPDEANGADKEYTAEPFYMENGKGVPVWMAREAVRLGHEVGLHGYNHQSLVKRAGYTSKGWKSKEAMVDALLLARKEWQRVFGSGTAPFTYIAPNNHIHRAGKEAVAQVFPEIRVMSAQYLDEGDLEGQEFDVDPDVSQFMDLPRTSSEFYVGPHNNVPMMDGVMLVGAWTHFVHPDDVYDPERRGGLKGWKDLNVASRKMIGHMRKSFPWLKSLTARDAYHELVRFNTASFRYEVSENWVNVYLGDASRTATPFVLRLDPGTRITGVKNGRILHGYTELGYYYLEGNGPRTQVAIARQ